MAGKGVKGSRAASFALEAHGDDQTVTIVLPRRSAEDLYYALAMALGGSAPLYALTADWAPGKRGNGKTPNGKTSPS